MVDFEKPLALSLNARNAKIRTMCGRLQSPDQSTKDGALEELEETPKDFKFDVLRFTSLKRIKIEASKGNYSTTIGDLITIKNSYRFYSIYNNDDIEAFIDDISKALIRSLKDDGYKIKYKINSAKRSFVCRVFWKK
jgi:hypothetical protein